MIQEHANSPEPRCSVEPLNQRNRFTQENPLCFGAVARRLLPAAAVMLFLSDGLLGRGSVLLFDSFGLGTTNNPRLDSGGSPVSIALGTDLSGIRAEIPNTSAAVWRAPGGHGAQSWAFTVSSADLKEPFSPFEPQASNNVANGTVTVLGGTTPTFPDALLDFNPPAGAIKVSADVLPGADPTVGTAIGLSASRTVLNSNFWGFGQAWLVVRGGTNFDTRSWELHTAGTSGPTAHDNDELGRGYGDQLRRSVPAPRRAVKGGRNEHILLMASRDEEIGRLFHSAFRPIIPKRSTSTRL